MSSSQAPGPVSLLTRRQIGTPLAAVLLLLVGIYLIHFYYIWTYAPDVPMWDDWSVLEPGNLSRELNWRWVWAFHNEHRIVFTKLQTWLLYRLNGWDIRTHIASNFLIYGALLGAMGAALCRLTRLPSWAALALLLPLLSCAAYENHLWAFQSQFHLFLLFAVLAALCLFDEAQRNSRLALGAVLSGLGIISFSAGVVCAVVILTMFAGFKAARMFSGHAPRREGLQLTLVALAVIGAMVAWFVGYVSPPYHPPPTWPHHAAFWVGLSDITAVGFGLSRSLGPLDFLFFALAVLPLVVILRPHAAARHWCLATIMLALLASLCAIIVGRAGLGGNFLKVRYVGIAAPLAVLAVAAWWEVLVARPRTRRFILIALALVLLVTHMDNWNFGHTYRRYAKPREEGLRLLADYYELVKVRRMPSPKDGPRLPLPFPRPLEGRFDRALELQISFARKIETARRAN